MLYKEEELFERVAGSSFNSVCVCVVFFPLLCQQEEKVRRSFSLQFLWREMSRGSDYGALAGSYGLERQFHLFLWLLKR